MLLLPFGEIASYRSVPWTILAHCIVVVWRWLSQVNGGSGRLRTVCPSVPISIGGEVLVFWVLRPGVRFCRSRPGRRGSTGRSAWVGSCNPLLAVSVGLWLDLSPLLSLRGYSVTLYSRIESPLTPATLSLCWSLSSDLPITTAMAAQSREQVGPFFLLGTFPFCVAPRAACLPSDISCPSPGAALALDELRRAYRAAPPPPPRVSPHVSSHFITLGINYCSLARAQGR